MASLDVVSSFESVFRHAQAERLEAMIQIHFRGVSFLAEEQTVAVVDDTIGHRG